MVSELQWTKGKWSIHRSVHNCGHHCSLRGRVYLTIDDGIHLDNPIRYDDGRIAYDFPERIPAFVRRAVERIII